MYVYMELAQGILELCACLGPPFHQGAIIIRLCGVFYLHSVAFWFMKHLVKGLLYRASKLQPYKGPAFTFLL